MPTEPREKGKAVTHTDEDYIEQPEADLARLIHDNQGVVGPCRCFGCKLVPHIKAKDEQIATLRAEVVRLEGWFIGVSQTSEIDSKNVWRQSVIRGETIISRKEKGQ